ncbi:hypothetical protein D3C80_1255140 [compost metagenome]
MHQHQITTLERTDIQSPTIQTQVLTTNVHAGAAWRRGVAWVTGQGQLLIQGVAALILHRQRRSQQWPFQFQTRLRAVQVAQFARTVQTRRPLALWLVQQAAAGEEQGVAFLGRQPLAGRNLVGQLEQPLIQLGAGQVVLFEQGQDQGLVAHRAAVVA